MEEIIQLGTIERDMNKSPSVDLEADEAQMDYQAHQDEDQRPERKMNEDQY